MPLITCPHGHGAMQEVTRSGVQLDVCPTCGGVWLDRGELEKILSEQKAEAAALEQSHRKFEREVEDFHRDPEAWRRTHPYDPHKGKYRYSDDDYYKYKKKKKFDIFDIFD